MRNTSVKDMFATDSCEHRSSITKSNKSDHINQLMGSAVLGTSVILATRLSAAEHADTVDNDEQFTLAARDVGNQSEFTGEQEAISVEQLLGSTDEETLSDAPVEIAFTNGFQTYVAPTSQIVSSEKGLPDGSITPPPDVTDPAQYVELHPLDEADTRRNNV